MFWPFQNLNHYQLSRKNATSATWLHHVQSDVSHHFTVISIHSMAKPWISRGISFKPFQWWENLHHITSKNKTFSSQILCRVMFLFFSPYFFWGDLQRRLRRLVILCLSRVDLEDEKLSVVLDYLKELLQELDTADADSKRRPLAQRQWYRLHSRVHGTDGLRDCDLVLF